MKISKSKQELARIISENGGWCAGHIRWLRTGMGVFIVSLGVSL